MGVRVGQHDEKTPSTRDAVLRLAPMSIVLRLLLGIGFGETWANVGMRPVLRAIETGVPGRVLAVLTLVAVVAPAALYLRRHALRTRVRWDADGITLLRGDRVATSIAWSEARVRSVLGDRRELVQIADRSGRRITLMPDDAWLGLPIVAGRHRIAPNALESIVETAREQHATFVADPPTHEPGMPVFRILAVLVITGSVVGPRTATDHAWALAIAVVCAILLTTPMRRMRAALVRPRALETLLIDAEERGHLRVRRLDGSRVLLDVAPAAHPDAMLPTRRGFVGAVLEVPRIGNGASYRAQETPIPATYVETRDDRVLRFETLRAALVDLVGYGAFFATSIAALLVGS